MEKPLQVTFHNIDHSDAVEEDVRARVARLEELYDRIVSCRVVVDSPHRNPAARGKTFSVRIELGLPGNDMVVSREPVGDLQLALNEGFDTVRRRLREHVKKQRGQ